MASSEIHGSHGTAPPAELPLPIFLGFLRAPAWVLRLSGSGQVPTCVHLRGLEKQVGLPVILPVPAGRPPSGGTPEQSGVFTTQQACSSSLPVLTQHGAQLRLVGGTALQCLLGNSSVSQQPAPSRDSVAHRRERSPDTKCVSVSFRHSYVW